MSYYRSIFWNDRKPSGEWKYPSVSYYRPNTPPLAPPVIPAGAKRSFLDTECDEIHSSREVVEFTRAVEDIQPNPEIQDYIFDVVKSGDPNLIALLDPNNN